MAYETLLYDKRNSIGYVKINRPEKLNALNRQVDGGIVRLLSSSPER